MILHYYYDTYSSIIIIMYLYIKIVYYGRLREVTPQAPQAPEA
jgi:hypothetical protein